MSQDLFRNIEITYYVVMIVVGILGLIGTIAAGLKALGPDQRAKHATTILIILPVIALFGALFIDNASNNLSIATIILMVGLSLLVINFLWVMKKPVGRYEILYLVLGCVTFSLNMTYVLVFHIYRDLGRILNLIEKLQGHN